ncbi:MAG: NAD(P)H-hydrate dehydratase [Candidatus Sumerlaeia bacterium]|nr:NAD(P)H-hydrate dehydratase [Candidatus Sumerlaeia bacterium]
MKIVTAEQMRRIDRITIEERGIPGVQLMEKAGQAVADAVCERFSPDSVAVVTGKGNNAGDGFVVARILHQRRIHVVVFLMADPEELRGDAKTMFEALPATVPRVRIEDVRRLADALPRFDLIVDAILGTGIQGPVKGLFGEAIEAINATGLPVVSVDIPSGLIAEGGPILGPVIRAAHTVTMGLPKLGMLVQPGIAYTGTVSVADLDFPADLLNDPNIHLNHLTGKMIAGLLPPRPADGHKGTFGSVLIIGGSPGMTGAPVMAARAAMRSGVGLVFCAVTEALQGQIAARLLEELTLETPSSDKSRFDLSSLPSLLGHISRMEAVALGPGIGRAEPTEMFVRRAVETIPVPLVVDADALNALAGHLEAVRQRKAATVLTPHPGEMSRLTGQPVAEIQGDRIGAARALAADVRAVVVLKGAQTVIADPDGEVFINPTGNTGLAKGGSGDVLTGLIAGLLAQSGNALSAALCGVFLHGLAADLCAETIPPRTMIASDVIANIPAAFSSLAKM